MQNILKKLQDSEMTASQIHERNFFQVVSPEKVFVVDVKDDGVVFGWAFQGKGEAGESVLYESGIGADECNLRFFSAVSCENDWQQAKERIEKCYLEYLYWTKEELLDHIKALRKAFIQRFTDRLKPLGFRKKSNHWKRTIGEKYEFEVHVQKSAYADRYYVNLSIEPLNWAWMGCFHTRIDFEGEYLLDWQLTPGDVIDRALDRMMDDWIRPAVEMDPNEFGKREYVSLNCHCSRKVCTDCWVEKNYWEYKGIPEPYGQNGACLEETI